MDKKRLKQLAGLNENMSSTLQQIAEQVYKLAESRASDVAADEMGRGFDRNAVMKQADTIFIEIKAHLEFKLKNHKF